MANVLSSPADLVNAALVKIGYRLQIGNLYDGSDAAQRALAIYGESRDAMLRENDWDFAQRSVVLTLLKSAPVSYVPPTAWDPATYPPLGWLYEYAYPDDCIKVRTVKPTLIFVPNFNPGPNAFSIANDDNYTPAKRVILSNVENAIGVYTGQVTDPLVWAVDFADAFVDRLSKDLATGLTGPQIAQLSAANANVDMARAELEQG